MNNEEEILFQLLEEDKKIRVKRIVEDRKLTTDDCLVLGMLIQNRQIAGLGADMAGFHNRIDETNNRIDETNNRIDETNNRIDELRSETSERIEELGRRLDNRIDSNFKWIVSLLMVMWVTTILAILVPVFLKIV